jgi:ABC-type multidrug transport system fused ATPase/permease subunit
MGIYLAGAFGGLILESGATRGQVELPSQRQRNEEDEAKEEKAFGRPLGRQVDLGFFSRMFVGGLAAFAVILIAKFLASGAKTEEFPTTASSAAAYAWAIAIVFTSPAAWAAMRRLAEARYKSALAVAKDQAEKTKRNTAAATSKIQHAKEKIQEATQTHHTIARFGSADLPELYRSMLLRRTCVSRSPTQRSCSIWHAYRTSHLLPPKTP